MLSQARTHLLTNQVRVTDEEDKGCRNQYQLCQGQQEEGGHAVPGRLDGQRQPQPVPGKAQRPGQVGEQDRQEDGQQQPGACRGPDCTAQHLHQGLIGPSETWGQSPARLLMLRGPATW